MVGQDMENEDGAVPVIRDDDIRQDGMGVTTAVTDDTHDPDCFPSGSTVPELTNAPFVITMDMAFPGGSTVWAGIFFRAIFGHMGLE